MRFVGRARASLAAAAPPLGERTVYARAHSARLRSAYLAARTQRAEERAGGRASEHSSARAHKCRRLPLQVRPPARLTVPRPPRATVQRSYWRSVDGRRTDYFCLPIGRQQQLVAESACLLIGHAVAALAPTTIGARPAEKSSAWMRRTTGRCMLAHRRLACRRARRPSSLTISMSSGCEQLEGALEMLARCGLIGVPRPPPTKRI